MDLYRAKFSTHCERVALALAHKGIEVESRWIDYDDRSEVEEVSGQGLVPVLADGDTVVFDSVRIVAHLEDQVPSPPLYPADEARRAELLTFIEWFDGVWKPLPERIEEELESPAPDQALVVSLGAEMAAALDRFESLLTGREYLQGPNFSAADCAAYPFLKYALSCDSADTELFHQILDEHQPLQDHHTRLQAWIERVSNHPSV